MSATWRVNNSTALGGEVCSQWQANHAYALGARCVCRVAYGTVAARAFVYEVTDDGTSHATTEPTWPLVVGNTVVDSGVTWTCRSPSDGSWDNASCYLQYMTNHAVAAAGGDTILVDQSHSETRSDTYSITLASTCETPLRIICVDKDNSDALSTGAVITNTTQELILQNGSLYSYGVSYVASGYSVKLVASSVSTHVVLEHTGGTVINCGWGHLLLVGVSDYLCNLEIINGDIDCSTRTYGIQMQTGSCMEWRGGAFIPNAGLGALFDQATSHSALAKFIGVDLSGLPSTCEIIGNHASAGYYEGQHKIVTLANCKLPATFAGIYSNTPQACNQYFPWNRTRALNCANGNIVCGLSEACGSGTISHDTGVYNSAGASNGTTNYSMKMVSSSKVVEPYLYLISTELTGWTTSTTEKTFTIECAWDSATNIQDDEIWMELFYPANNSNPLCGITNDRCAILGTPANQTASTATWTGTGAWSNENKFKLSVTVTPGKAGPICARVYLAKPSTTVYIDPMITES